MAKGARDGQSANLSYQGTNKGSGKATISGINGFDMKDHMGEVPSLAMSDPKATETREQLANITSPESKVTIYRATIGDSINKGDWIFLSNAQAEKWTKTAFGTPKPGVKVIKKVVKAKNINWAKKNLEFVYIGE